MCTREPLLATPPSPQAVASHAAFAQLIEVGGPCVHHLRGRPSMTAPDEKGSEARPVAAFGTSLSKVGGGIGWHSGIGWQWH